MKKKHCETIFKSAPSDTTERPYLNNITSDDLMTITLREVIAAVKSLNAGKSADHMALSGEHIKYSDDRLIAIIMLCPNAILQYGYLPDQFMKSIITPIVINRISNIKDAPNYRPIAVASTISKIFEKSSNASNS